MEDELTTLRVYKKDLNNFLRMKFKEQVKRGKRIGNADFFRITMMAVKYVIKEVHKKGSD